MQNALRILYSAFRPMTLSTVLFLFLVHLGLGVVFALVFVSREAGVKFFRFNAGLAALLIAAGFAFRPSDAGLGAAGGVAFLALVTAEIAIVIYWATVGRALASIRPTLVATACAAGFVVLVAQALAVEPDRGMTVQAMTIASFLSS